MKKNILSIVLAIFSFIAYAQNEPIKKMDIGFGFKGGLNLSFITGDDTNQFDGKIAFHIGAVSEIPISDKFSFQPELLYSAQGDKFSADGMDITYKMDYLNIPFMVKYYLSDGFSLEAGPQIGFLLSSKFEGEGVSVDVKDIMKKVEFALGLGLGYKLENGLNFSGRYNLGLSNIVKSNGTVMGEVITSEGAKNHNEVVQLSIGYFF